MQAGSANDTLDALNNQQDAGSDIDDYPSRPFIGPSPQYCPMRAPRPVIMTTPTRRNKAGSPMLEDPQE
ncbi:uncharacterized protein LAESUDRAFT_756828 [Laetiporus sulphureus 93-53]|uniref:Uncharacterized protein n=1 Tax=Laetiporus sulphureus 93-53 TaxID=1314785 RepID=A0A165FMC4_9APHY|nr:uncharacterized protein LAESUDRAFT_756828 [Laetiporus sulphureus 93-53]KZT09187.1 hypothetical protein LAESUDRAFT_756828 [Laetiporus sulphureus 93-53]